MLLKVLAEAKVPKEQVERVYLSPTDALPAVTQGHVDAWSPSRTVDDEAGNCKKGIGVLESGQKRTTVEQMRGEYPASVVCVLLEYGRSSLYYQASAPTDENGIRAAIVDVAGRYAKYGYRRVTQQLKREGHRVNHKRIARLMGEMGLCGKAFKRRQRTTNSNHEYGRYPNLVMELVIERPDQVWVGNIIYIRLQQEFVYLAVLMDVFTRRISPKETLRERGWHYFAEAYEQIGTFLEEVYSKKRIHSSLGCLTPSEYEIEWNEQRNREYNIREESP